MALMKAHPRFREIMTALTDATVSHEPVWYITRSGCILDLLRLSPEDDVLLFQ
jgi:hypothetical protein